MVTSVSAFIGSKFTISAASRRVAVPPYCGLPSLSHQLAAVTVVVEVVLEVGIVVVVDAGFDVVVTVVVDVVIWFEVEVGLEQDTRTNDDTIKHVNIIQMAPLFTSHSFLPENISLFIFS
jgi:hypothetical protein